jgi:hypothetical protein
MNEPDTVVHAELSPIINHCQRRLHLSGSAIAALSVGISGRSKPARPPRGVAIVAACPTPPISIRRTMLALLGTTRYWSRLCGLLGFRRSQPKEFREVETFAVKAANLSFVLFAAMLGGGCNISLSENPLYSPNVVKTRDELVGTWVELENPAWKGQTRERLEITKTQDEGVYGIENVTGSQATKTTFRLVELGDSLYADVLTPPEMTGRRPPAHLIFLVKIKGDYIGIASVDRAKLKARLETDPIAYENVSRGALILKAETDDLQRFFRDAGEDLFSFDDVHQIFNRVKTESKK